MKELKYLGIKSEIKDVDLKTRKISAYVSSFHNKDHDGDIILPGAFSKSINERGPSGSNQIMFLAQHDSWRPLGKPEVLLEDAKGLYAESKIVNTSYGDDYIKLYEAGIINEHSIGFSIIKANEDRENTRAITEVKLYEFSAVTWGANEQTPFLGWKSYDAIELNDLQKRIIKELKTGTLTDDTFVQLELSLSQIVKASFELGKSSVKSPEPIDFTLKQNNPNILTGLINVLEKN